MNDIEISEEMAWEESGARAGTAAYWKRVDAAEQAGKATTTAAGQRLLKELLGPVSDRIKVWVAEALNRPGKHHGAVDVLSQVDPGLAAYAVLRTLVDCVAKDETKLLTAALSIGKYIRDELRWAYFEGSSPHLYDSTINLMKNNPAANTEARRRNIVNHAMKKYQVVWEEWPKEKCLHVGAALVGVMVSTGLFEIVRDCTDIKKTVNRIRPTTTCTDALSVWRSNAAIMTPERLPMLIPPKPWTNNTDGGYYHKRLKYRLIRTRGMLFVHDPDDNVMPSVYVAVNAIQQTGWRINNPLFTAVQAVWEAGIAIKGTPPKYNTPLIPKPEWSEKTPEPYRRWKKENAEIFRKNRRWDGQRAALIRLFGLAKHLVDKPQFYFPVQLDFRGRVYYYSQILHPQGSDMARALLEFSEGLPLGERGVHWLKIHLANMYGVDKVSIPERVQWTEDNEAKIIGSAENPLDCRWWADADKPWQFLAACIDYAGYKQVGEGYVSRIPVTVDGSCNGIQILSAASRDEVAGRQVNLCPSENPKDIYQAVADRTTELLKADQNNPELYPKDEKASYRVPCSTLAAGWLAWGIGRKDVKRQVMVLPYGGTYDSLMAYTRQAVTDRCDEKGVKPPFEKGWRRASAYLAKKIQQAMHEVVVGPVKVMAWIKSLAKETSKANLPMRWTSPSGFVVHQAYRETSKGRITTRINGDIYKITLDKETEVLGKFRQKTAVAPNWTHSMDAAVLVFTVNNLIGSGVSNLLVVHDSFGTHAASMDMLSDNLRAAFHRMFKEHDVLGELKKAIGDITGKANLPPAPEAGTLDIDEVRNAQFIFS